MADNQFIARNGLIALDDSQITGSLSLTGAVTGSIFSGSFVGDGSQLDGIDGFPFTGSAAISGSLIVDGSIVADSLTVNNNPVVTGAGWGLRVKEDNAIAFTDGGLGDNYTKLNLGEFSYGNYEIYRRLANDYAYTTLFIQHDENIASNFWQNYIQLYTRAWNTTSKQLNTSIEFSLNSESATNSGSFSEATWFLRKSGPSGSLTNGAIGFQFFADDRPSGVGSIAYGKFFDDINQRGIEYGGDYETNFTNRSLVTKQYVTSLGYSTTGSNQFNGNQAITGSLTVTGQVIAQSLNVQQVTSSIVYSSGSNVFGSDLGNTQQFTGSVFITGSLNVNGTTAGTVRSVGLSSSTSGVTIGGSPITTSGSLTLAIDTATSTMNGLLSSTDWSTFNNKENAISAGTTAQYYRGDKTFQTLNTAAVTESTNLYYTEARVNANTNVAANTAARHAAVTLGTANGLSLSTQQLSLGLASTSANGALSSTDWNTFNGKQNALTNPVTGTGTSGQVAYFTGTSAISSESNLFWDATNNRLGINQSSPLAPLHVGSESSSDDANVQRWDYAGSSAYQLILKQTVTSGVVRWNFSQINNSTAFNNVLVLDRGNVGMGITNPTAPLHVLASGAEASIFASSNSTTMFTSYRVNTSTDVGYIGNGNGIVTGGGNTNFGVRSQNDLIFASGGNNRRITLTSGGNLGINITSPSSLLHVAGTVSYGSVRVSPSGTNGESAIAFFTDTAGTDTNDAWVVGHAGWGNTGDFVIGNENNGAGGNVRLLIEKAGNVGINTTSPSSRLSVCSTTACSTVVDVQGCAGQLFSVTDNLVGEIFAVSDISGIPILGVNSNGTVSVDSKIAVGANHTVSGAYASVTGGVCNTASGGCSTVSGGYLNTACFGLSCGVATGWAFVGGGCGNTAGGIGAAIAGGRSNSICGGNYGFIGGGNSNSVSGYNSTIGGGSSNCVSSPRATVGGGLGNTASGYYSTISGGTGNCASGDRSFIGGGIGNTVSGGYNSSVVGGCNNFARCNWNFIGGGTFNTTELFFNSVVGGAGNCAYGNRSAVLTGQNNCASCYASAIGSGVSQTNSANYEFRVQTLSKASGTFRIDHPNPSKTCTHYLSHSFVESPTAGDNIYRYKVNVVNGTAVINLPSYYKYLNENDQIWVTSQGHFGIGYGEINIEQTQLTIYSSVDGEYNVLLIGTRKDTDARNSWSGVEVYK